jgi:hypothetical protein
VFSRDVNVHDVDARHYVNLRRLLEPEYQAYRSGGGKALPLVVILDKGKPIKAVRADRGRVPLADLRWYGPGAMERARKENGGAFLLAVELATARTALREIEERVKLGEDGVAQALHVARVIQAHVGEGIYLAPRVLQGVPVPSYEAVQRTFDLLYPDDRSVVVYVFDRTEIHTSLIAVKRRGDITELTSHLAIGGEVRDWHRDYPRLLQAVERRCAKPHIGVFIELAAWQRIATGASSVSRELAQRTVVFDPAPPWLMGMVAADAGAQVAKVGFGLLSRFVPDNVMKMAKDVAQTAAERGPFALLGFNPFAVAGQLLRLRRPPAD